jgi:hypothetical protein
LAVVGGAVGRTDKVGETDVAGDELSAAPLEPWPQPLATATKDRTRAAHIRQVLAAVDR